MTTGLEYLDEFLVKTRQPFNYAWAVLNEDANGDMQLGFVDYRSDDNYRDSAEVVVDGYLSLQQVRRFKDAEFVAFMAGAYTNQDRLLLVGGDSAWVLEPNSLEVKKEQEQVFWNRQPIRYAFMSGDPGHNESGARSVLIAENGKFYVGDKWGYLYDVDLDPNGSVPSDYTISAAYPVRSPGAGCNIVWDAEKHQFYFQDAATSSTADGRYSSSSKSEATLKNVRTTANEDMVSDADLAGMNLVWLGKGVKSLVSRTSTATALMSLNDGSYRFIHFATTNKTDGYATIYVEDEAANFEEHVIDNNTCFAATNAFDNCLFFTENSQVWCLIKNESGRNDIIEIGEPVNGTIVDMDFRITEDGQGGFPPASGNFQRILAVAYNTPDGVGVVKEIFVDPDLDVDHETIHSGFGRITEIEYMPRRTKIL